MRKEERGSREAKYSREQEGNDQNANDDDSQSDPSAPVIPSRVFVGVALPVDDSIASLALCEIGGGSFCHECWHFGVVWCVVL